MRDFVNFIGSTATGGVSAKLAVRDRAWAAVVFQQGKRPIDAELNLAQAVIAEQQRLALKRLFGSGIAANWSPAVSGTANVAWLHSATAPQSVLVDGRLITLGDGGVFNRVIATLSAPPGAGTREDFVFLEVWYEEVQPAGSPEAASSQVFNGGNVANAALTNDLLVIPGTESTRRIQARYRIRVVDNISSASFPAGFQSSSVLARGGAASPVAARTFTQETEDSGLWTCGDGGVTDGTTFKSVDGYVYAIPLAFIARSAGVTSIPTNAITFIARRATAFNADTVDGYHANATPTPLTLCPLDATGKIPASTVPSTINADTVDTFHASGTATANTLLPLDSQVKFPNSVLRTGSGNGLDADLVDGYHVAASPTASRLLPLDATAKFPNSVLRTGSGNGLDADKVDGYNAAATATASTLLPLDATAKFPNSVLRTGSGNGLDADKVDGYNASATPTAGALLVLDGSAKFPNSALRTGHGNGLDADTLDGLQASAFAPAGHSHDLLAASYNNIVWSGSNIGTSYTVVGTYAFNLSGSKVFMFMVDSYTTDPNSYSVALFINGVQSGFFPVITDVGGGTRLGGGMITLPAGNNSVTVRARCNDAGQTIGSISGSFSAWSATFA